MEIHDTIVGTKRCYHIDRCITKDGVPVAFSAFSRRQSGRGLKRRYYALLAFLSSASDDTVHTSLNNAFAMLPYHARVEEEIINEDYRLVVVARGKVPKDPASRLNGFLNK